MSHAAQDGRWDAQRMREANAIQALASDPTCNVWVSASAGTGKTELLARRVFRLLLADPTLKPEALVALTFTRHGAGEIAQRLREKLELYARDPALAEDELQSAGTPERWAALQAAWRTGPVLVTTIHGLAQRCLQKWGPEGVAEIQLLNEYTQRAWLLELQKTLLADTGDRLAHLAPLLERLLTELGEESWKSLTGALLASWPKLTECLRDGGGQGMQRRLQTLLGVGDQALWARQRTLPNAEENAVLGRLATLDAKVAPLWQALQTPEAFGADALWQKFLLTDGKPRKSLLTKAQRAGAATVGVGEADLALLEAAQPRVAEQVRLQHAWRQWELSTALVGWAAALKEAYETQKAQAGVVDYQDVLDRFEAALADPQSQLAAQLERQFRHLLLDEGQDNSPQQDRIVRTLCRNLLAGEDGGQPRTVLAVGDVKQSIFRFQGAAPELFVGLREELQQWAGTRFREVDVGHNFRSLPGILAAVDTVFGEPALAEAVQGEPKDWPTHTAVRAAAPATVALWCGVAGDDDDDEKAATLPAWSLPEVRWANQKTAALLPQAEQLAAWLPSVLGQTLPGRETPLTWQDVLLLAPSNKALLLLAGVLQQGGIPIGRVTGWVAPVVADAVAYLRVLAAPGDALSLATVAKSPHGWGWDDAQLLALQEASARVGEDTDWEAGLATLTPERLGALVGHRALAQTLTPVALLWRLIDDFGWPLAPLTGLLQWASAAPTLLHLIARAEQEPLPEGEGDTAGVRLLTVHKAKGLQAPLVVLFDTANNIHHSSKADKIVWDATHNTVLVQPKRGLSPAVDALLDDAQAEKFYDHMRLLYVAMTRAEHRLVALGPNPATAKPVPDSWWQLMTARLPYAMVLEIHQPQPQD